MKEEKERCYGDWSSKRRTGGRRISPFSFFHSFFFLSTVGFPDSDSSRNEHFERHVGSNSYYVSIGQPDALCSRNCEEIYDRTDYESINLHRGHRPARKKLKRTIRLSKKSRNIGTRNRDRFRVVRNILPTLETIVGRFSCSWGRVRDRHGEPTSEIVSPYWLLRNSNSFLSFCFWLCQLYLNCYIQFTLCGELNVLEMKPSTTVLASYFNVHQWADRKSLLPINERERST